MKILLIEPDQMLARNIAALFAAAGHEVHWQVDPQVAVNYLDEVRIDAIVMDMVLCQHSAIEMLYEIRSYIEWRHLPVIIFSSLPAREVINCVAALDQLGVSAYHHKAFTPISNLVKTVGSYQLTPA
jgi:DNA-binding response OmpR family regulator